MSQDTALRFREGKVLLAKALAVRHTKDDALRFNFCIAQQRSLLVRMTVSNNCYNIDALLQCRRLRGNDAIAGILYEQIMMMVGSAIYAGLIF